MRRRYVQLADGELVEVSLYAQIGETPNHDRALWGDRHYADAGDRRFHSRTTHREYMRSRNLTTADDYRQEWASAQKARDDAVLHGPRDPNRAADVARAMDAVARGHKPQRFAEDEF